MPLLHLSSSDEGEFYDPLDEESKDENTPSPRPPHIAGRATTSVQALVEPTLQAPAPSSQTQPVAATTQSRSDKLIRFNFKEDELFSRLTGLKERLNTKETEIDGARRTLEKLTKEWMELGIAMGRVQAELDIVRENVTHPEVQLAQEVGTEVRNSGRGRQPVGIGAVGGRGRMKRGRGRGRGRGVGGPRGSGEVGSVSENLELEEIAGGGMLKEGSKEDTGSNGPTIPIAESSDSARRKSQDTSHNDSTEIIRLKPRHLGEITFMGQGLSITTASPAIAESSTSMRGKEPVEDTDINPTMNDKSKLRSNEPLNLQDAAQSTPASSASREQPRQLRTVSHEHGSDLPSTRRSMRRGHRDHIGGLNRETFRITMTPDVSLAPATSETASPISFRPHQGDPDLIIEGEKVADADSLANTTFFDRDASPAFLHSPVTYPAFPHKEYAPGREPLRIRNGIRPAVIKDYLTLAQALARLPPTPDPPFPNIPANHTEGFSRSVISAIIGGNVQNTFCRPGQKAQQYPVNAYWAVRRELNPGLPHAPGRKCALHVLNSDESRLNEEHPVFIRHGPNSWRYYGNYIALEYFYLSLKGWLSEWSPAEKELWCRYITKKKWGQEIMRRGGLGAAAEVGERAWTKVKALLEREDDEHPQMRLILLIMKPVRWDEEMFKMFVEQKARTVRVASQEQVRVRKPVGRPRKKRLKAERGGHIDGEEEIEEKGEEKDPENDPDEADGEESAVELENENDEDWVFRSQARIHASRPSTRGRTAVPSSSSSSSLSRPSSMLRTRKRTTTQKPSRPPKQRKATLPLKKTTSNPSTITPTIRVNGNSSTVYLGHDDDDIVVSDLLPHSTSSKGADKRRVSVARETVTTIPTSSNSNTVVMATTTAAGGGAIASTTGSLAAKRKRMEAEISEDNEDEDEDEDESDDWETYCPRAGVA